VRPLQSHRPASRQALQRHLPGREILQGGRRRGARRGAGAGRARDADVCDLQGWGEGGGGGWGECEGVGGGGEEGGEGGGVRGEGREVLRC